MLWRWTLTVGLVYKLKLALCVMALTMLDIFIADKICNEVIRQRTRVPNQYLTESYNAEREEAWSCHQPDY